MIGLGRLMEMERARNGPAPNGPAPNGGHEMGVIHYLYFSR